MRNADVDYRMLVTSTGKRKNYRTLRNSVCIQTQSTQTKTQKELQPHKRQFTDLQALLNLLVYLILLPIKGACLRWKASCCRMCCVDPFTNEMMRAVKVCTVYEIMEYAYVVAINGENQALAQKRGKELNSLLRREFPTWQSTGVQKQDYQGFVRTFAHRH